MGGETDKKKTLKTLREELKKVPSNKLRFSNLERYLREVQAASEENFGKAVTKFFLELYEITENPT